MGRRSDADSRSVRKPIFPNRLLAEVVTPPKNCSMTPEERAAELVIASANHVGLRGPGLAPYQACHHSNPALVREAEAALRAFVAAVIREARVEAEKLVVGGACSLQHVAQPFEKLGRGSAVAEFQVV